MSIDDYVESLHQHGIATLPLKYAMGLVKIYGQRYPEYHVYLDVVNDMCVAKHKLRMTCNSCSKE